eukprot:2582631-Rhodomonas_salina.3
MSGTGLRMNTATFTIFVRSLVLIQRHGGRAALRLLEGSVVLNGLQGLVTPINAMLGERDECTEMGS